MIDLHCHILPECDDGPGSMAESLEMVRIAYQDGIRRIVATPHDFNGRTDNLRGLILSSAAELNKAAQALFPDMEILPGCEIKVIPGIFLRVQAGELATIGDSGRYVLVEFPFTDFPDQLLTELTLLIDHGLIPIIAHPERSLGFQRNIQRLFRLINQGCLSQLTAASISGGFGGYVRKFAKRLIILRLAHIIASDAHSPLNRPPILSPAVALAEQLMGDKQEADNMVNATPTALLAGRCPDVPKPIQQRKKHWFFKG